MPKKKGPVKALQIICPLKNAANELAALITSPLTAFLFGGAVLGVEFFGGLAADLRCTFGEVTSELVVDNLDASVDRNCVNSSL